MPLVHISLRKGKSDHYRQAIFDGVYQAMRDTFSVPEDDQFMTITEHGPSNFRYGASYLNIARSDDVIFIQISAMNSRTPEQKKALYARTVELLCQNPGMRAEDVFINIVEGVKENWSLGNGIAQYANHKAQNL
ncbi:4-oxalocrotonate tautomerase [Ruegeria profundi]|uniref:4-oxalocrotonate tautomerase n=2 Tax=Ruegeria profundi TaxID=1685378 RepID=A0A0X3U030_9RHOB|nr:4-oxalocrotonate tautomerase [Ruegeria profundi]